METHPPQLLRRKGSDRKPTRKGKAGQCIFVARISLHRGTRKVRRVQAIKKEEGKRLAMLLVRGVDLIYESRGGRPLREGDKKKGKKGAHPASFIVGKKFDGIIECGCSRRGRDTTA